MTLKLTGSGISPFVKKVRVFCAEKGLDYEHDPMVPFGVSDEYKAKHPQGKVPLLEDGDRIIPDSSAICAYLERLEPTPALYPSDAYAYARAIWYEEFADAGLINATIPFFQERVLGPVFFKREPDLSKIEQAEKEALPPFFTYLEQALGGADFFVEDRFGIADISLGAQFANYSYGEGTVDTGRWPRLAAWLERVHTRPSFKAVIEQDLAGIEAMRAG